MSQTFAIDLAAPASEMAQEEIQKQAAHLSKQIGQVRFRNNGSRLEFEAPTADGPALTDQMTHLAQQVQQSLRHLQRNIVYRSEKIDRPVFRGNGRAPGIHHLGNGQVALEGIPLGLFRYFDRVFEALGRLWQAQPLQTPTLIPAPVLSRCGYFRSFPQNVTFACHLFEDAQRIEDFRARHQDRDQLDDQALRDMETPEACLSPAVCYHVYHVNQNRTLPAAGLAYGVCGKCFRYESSNLSDLRRLWDFTMREVVFLGSRDEVLRRRQQGIEMVGRFLDEHQLAGEIRTASDPFFLSPEAMAKTYFQLSSKTKYEISLLLPDEGRLAVGSLNAHADFFGRTFQMSVEGAGAAHTACVAFGLERWVHAFLAQHGDDRARWPKVVRQAPEWSALNL